MPDPADDLGHAVLLVELDPDVFVAEVAELGRPAPRHTPWRRALLPRASMSRAATTSSGRPAAALEIAEGRGPVLGGEDRAPQLAAGEARARSRR